MLGVFYVRKFCFTVERHIVESRLSRRLDSAKSLGMARRYRRQCTFRSAIPSLLASMRKWGYTRCMSLWAFTAGLSGAPMLRRIKLI